jgi:esterase/lipase superfamily enzyme
MATAKAVGQFATSALALASEVSLKGSVPASVKNAHKALRDKISEWARGEVDAFEKAPTSPARLAIANIVDLQSEADRDAVLALARRLIDALFAGTNGYTEEQLEVLVENRAVFDESVGKRIKIDIQLDELVSVFGGTLYSDISDKLEKSLHLDKCEYTVWYGTNRRPRDPLDASKGYSGNRDGRIHYGNCRVYIPKAHKIGSVGSPWWKRLATWTDDRIKLREIREFDGKDFWQQLEGQLAVVPAAERQAVIFVHGYNVSFRDAAVRAAQIGFDLSIKGAMAFFSWPSRGNLKGYMADQATIEASEEDISGFMTNFVTQSGAEAVHIIAHSMGNRGVLRAVNRIAERAQQRSGMPFGQIILAAADVDADSFRKLSTAYAKVARQTTLYVSKRDRAVEASHWLHQFPRAGFMPPVCVVPGIDTIGVANIDMTLLGHAYIGEAREVLTDIHQLIATGSPPHQRFGLEEHRTESGERYWLVRA